MDYVSTISVRIKRHNGEDFEKRKDVDLYHDLVGEIINSDMKISLQQLKRFINLMSILPKFTELLTKYLYRSLETRLWIETLLRALIGIVKRKLLYTNQM